MKIRMKNLLITLLISCLPDVSFASGTTRTIPADVITTSGGVSQTVPVSAGTLLNTVSTTVPVAASLTQEVPSGSCNGSNTTLTLSHTPGGSTSVHLYLDGVFQIQGSGKDYTISGSTITLLTACASGQTPTAEYSLY